MQLWNSKLTRPGVLFGLASGIAPFTAGAHGAVVYGNFVGNDVTYLNVNETPTQLPGPTPTELFGPPTISADSLLFSAANFSVGASGGANEFQDGHLNMGNAPNGSFNLKAFDLLEGGGWAVGGGTNATTALETLVVNDLVITSINHVPVNPITVAPTITFTDTNNGSATVVKTPSSIQFKSSGGFSTGSWNADANFNISAALAADGFAGSIATGMTLDLDNQLAVTSEANSDAFIDKKFFDITTSQTPVPEPSTVGLAVLACAGFAMRRRHRIAGSAVHSVGSAMSAIATGGIRARRTRRRS